MVGCVGDSTRTQLTLFSDALSKDGVPLPQTRYPPWNFHGQPASNGYFLLTLNGVACDTPKNPGGYALRVHCPVGLAGQQHDSGRVRLRILANSSSSSSSPGRDLSVAMQLWASFKHLPRHDLLHCSSVVAFGDLEIERSLLQQQRLRWAGLNSSTSLVFARSVEGCGALESVAGVSCHVMPGIDGSSPWYDQPAAQQLCLDIGRLTQARFIAFADADDLSPETRHREQFWHLLNEVDEARELGLHLFFDAELACPEWYCPPSEAEWLKHCPAPQGGRRAHWKAIVVPSVDHVEMHTWKHMGKWGTRVSWGPVCFHHMRRSNRTLPAQTVVIV